MGDNGTPVKPPEDGEPNPLLQPTGSNPVEPHVGKDAQLVMMALRGGWPQTPEMRELICKVSATHLVNAAKRGDHRTFAAMAKLQVAIDQRNIDRVKLLMEAQRLELDREHLGMTAGAAGEDEGESNFRKRLTGLVRAAEASERLGTPAGEQPASGDGGNGKPASGEG